MPKCELTHSNQLHQLLVSVSRHLYVQKNGLLKYQQKPLDVSFSNLKKSRKEHLVYYILRDALSGTFFLEITTSQAMIPLLEFLCLAWEKGSGKYIWGLPEQLSIPKGLAVEELREGLDALGVQVVLPASGFAAGVRIIRDIEDCLCYLMGRMSDHRPQVLNTRCKDKLYDYLLGLNHDEQYNKYEKWLGAIPEQGIRDVPDRETILLNFQETDEPVSGVLWLKTKKKMRFKVPAWEGDTWPLFDQDRYYRADDLVCDAYDIADRDVRIKYAWDALEISPYCVDAFNLLADESDLLDEKISFYDKAVCAGRLMLGNEYIQTNAGHFWMIIETRPYMRALRGYADSLREAGRIDRAIDIYWELLRLNPNDNQGNRYILSACLLEGGRDQEMRLLMARYGDEKTCFIAYDKTLWTYRVTGGANERSNMMLQEALESNQCVPAYLLGEKAIPWRKPNYYGMGDENEAIIYASHSRKAWEQTPGALEWLKGKRVSSA